MVLLKTLLAYLLFVSVIGKLSDYYSVFNYRQQWKYLTKFGADTEQVSWEGKFRYGTTYDKNKSESTTMTVGVYSHNRLDAALEKEDCKERMRLANYMYDIEIPNDGDWSLPLNRTLPKQKEVTFWYFAIANCETAYENRQKLYYNIRMLNEDSEFSYEDKGLVELFSYLSMIFLVALTPNLYYLFKSGRKKDSFPLQVSLLIAAIATHLVSLLCQLLHLKLYESNGYGMSILDYGYLLLSEGSTLLISHVLLTIASGWTLSYSEFPERELVTPVCILIFIVEMMVVGLGRVTDDSHKKHSDFEGSMGIVMVGIRTAIGIWFVYYAKDLYKKLTFARQKLLLDLSVPTCIFYFSLAFIVVFSYGMSCCSRNYLVLVGTHVSKIFIFYYLSWFFRESGRYGKQSTLAQGVLQSKYN